MQTELRPSMLPKLAECPCFVSSPAPSEAAERGTNVDNFTRALLAGEITEQDLHQQLKADEVEAVRWMASFIKTIAGNVPIITDKIACKMDRWHPFITGGEQDCRCPELQMSFDFKTGQLRSYKEQQACYAVSEMEVNFVSSWTCYCVFGDQKTFIKYEFTYDEAKALVQRVVDSVRSPKPVLCDYCGWCARQDDCPLRAKTALAVSNQIADINSRDTWFNDIVLANPDKLAEFLDGAKVIEDYAKKAKAKALELINDGISVPGYIRQSRKGLETIPPDVVGHYIQEIGFGDILNAYGNLSAEKFREIWKQKKPGEPFPEDKIKIGAGSSFVKKSASKKK